MALFAQELVLNSRYFSDTEEERLSYFLHVPIDSIVIERLTTLGLRMPFGNIKGIDCRSKFYKVQDALASAAMQSGIPRVWFDDNWGDRQKRQYRPIEELSKNPASQRPFWGYNPRADVISTGFRDRFARKLT